MADTPPRRSRRPPNARSDATFPLVPFLIGVVVLGFVIGAGLSMAGRHGSTQQVAALPVATAEPTDTPAPTLAPLATARPLPATTQTRVAETASPMPESSASDVPTPKPTPKPSPRHLALTSLAPQATSAPSPAATPTATTAPTPQPVTVHTHAPAAVKAAVATAAPEAKATASPASATSVPATASAAPPASSIEADSDFGRLSANVVKQYLRALERGDTESAAGAFAPGTPNLAFPERSILDASAQIGTISARGSNDAQTVNVTISTSGGTYYGTYDVHKTSTGAAVIVSRSISKG